MRYQKTLMFRPLAVLRTHIAPRHRFAVTALVALTTLATGSATLAAPATATEPTPAAGPYTYLHHPVSTDNAAAQLAFDRGLTLLFAYEPWEAEQSFRQAARLDPGLAMAWWGVGLSDGPNINVSPTAEMIAK
ncbi:MAG: hypothetical protein JO042_10910, partial [Sinobacteraceae bacterium]|nr:hypothetical protein [Nevskiaceae bacterium]